MLQRNCLIEYEDGVSIAARQTPRLGDAQTSVQGRCCATNVVYSREHILVQDQNSSHTNVARWRRPICNNLVGLLLIRCHHSNFLRSRPPTNPTPTITILCRTRDVAAFPMAALTNNFRICRRGIPMSARCCHRHNRLHLHQQKSRPKMPKKMKVAHAELFLQHCIIYCSVYGPILRIIRSSSSLFNSFFVRRTRSVNPFHFSSAL